MRKVFLKISKGGGHVLEFLDMYAVIIIGSSYIRWLRMTKKYSFKILIPLKWYMSLTFCIGLQVSQGEKLKSYLSQQMRDKQAEI